MYERDSYLFKASHTSRTESVTSILVSEKSLKKKLQKVLSGVMAKSCHFGKKQPNGRPNTNKAKTGQLWHKDKAYLWKMLYMRGGPVATDKLCPLCGQPDSGSSTFSEVVHTLK